MCLENNAIIQTITKSITTNIIKAIELCRTRWAGPVAGLQKIMAQNNLVVKFDRKIQHRRKLVLGDIAPPELIKVRCYINGQTSAQLCLSVNTTP